MQVQWTLLDGVNDGDDEIDGLVRLLAGRYAVLNLIPYNAVDGLALRAARWPSGRARWRASCTGAASSPSCASRRGRTWRPAAGSCARGMSAATSVAIEIVAA